MELISWYWNNINQTNILQRYTFQMEISNEIWLIREGKVMVMVNKQGRGSSGGKISVGNQHMGVSHGCMRVVRLSRVKSRIFIPFLIQKIISILFILKL